MFHAEVLQMPFIAADNQWRPPEHTVTEHMARELPANAVRRAADF